MAENDDIAAYLAEHDERQILLLRSPGGQAPNTGGMEQGELAVCYARGSETLYVKNTGGEAVPFSSDTLMSAMVSTWVSSWVSYEQSYPNSGDDRTVKIGTITIGEKATAIYAPRHSAATSSALGMVRLGSDAVQGVGANAVTGEPGRTYAVQLNASSQMVVNVPWTDSGGDGGGGSTVSYSPTLTGGTKIGTITIDGESTTIYAPSQGSSGSTVTYESAQASGDLIGTLTIDGTPYKLYCANDGSGGSEGGGTTYSVATSSVLGLVMLGSDTVQGVAANTVTSESGRTYAVQLNASSQMVVNVPWTDTVSGGGGGSTVSYSPTLTSGTEIGKLTIDGATTTLYCSSGGNDGSTVSFTQTQTSGTKIGAITIDGASTDIYSPSVSYSPTLTSGTEVGKLTIDGTTTTLYCASGGGGSGSDVNVTNTLSTSSVSVYVTGTSSPSTSTGTQLFSGGFYFVPSSGYVYAPAYYETSDARLKEGISDVSAEDMSREISIREFSFRSDESKTRKYGVIAQELEAAGLGNLVSTGGDGVKSVDYISMLCLKIRQLEERIRELENKE